MAEKQAVIYALLHPLTEEVRYIGKTVQDIRERLYRHIWRAQRETSHVYNVHKSVWIRSLLKGGLEPILSVLEIVSPSDNWQERERYWIALARKIGCDLTNITDGGEGGVGYSPSPDTRAKLSAALTGRKRSLESCAKTSAALMGHLVSAETRTKMSVARKGKPGHKNTPETRAKMSIAHKGKKFTDAHRANMSAAHKGIPLTEEHRAAIGRANRGRVVTPATRAKISIAHKGRTYSPEVRARMSAGHKGFKHSDETRQKMSRTRQGEGGSNVKLTEGDVKVIRRLYASGKYRQTELAEHFGVSKHTIWDIVHRKTWRHI